MGAICEKSHSVLKKQNRNFHRIKIRYIILQRVKTPKESKDSYQPELNNKTEVVGGGGNLSPSHSYQFDASASNRCPDPGEGSQVSRRAPEEQHSGITATPASN